MTIAFVASMVASAHHLATEQHDLASPSSRSVRAPSLQVEPCRAPSHRAHPAADHECVLDDEDQKEDPVAAHAATDVELEPPPIVAEGPAPAWVLPAPAHDDEDVIIPPAVSERAADRPRGPPLA